MDPNVGTPNVYVPQPATPQVYSPPFQQPPVPPPPNSNKWKIFAAIGILLVFIMGSFLIFKVIQGKNTYQKNKAWVIPQSLNTALSKQQLLAQSGSNIASSGPQVEAISTYSGIIRPEAVKIGKDYLLSTGASGEISLDLPRWTYKVSIVPIPGVDLTGVPSKISLDGGKYDLEIGVLKGSGKIKGQKNNTSAKSSEGTTKLKVSLFHDKNGNGEKGTDEPSLPWAGVTLKLTET